jgi:hypothetical protein
MRHSFFRASAARTLPWQMRRWIVLDQWQGSHRQPDSRIMAAISEKERIAA